MPSPFPGMDPYLEHPALWPDVHNSLLAALRDALSPQVAPHYYVALERRTYLLTPDDLVFVGRPDVAVVRRAESGPPGQPPAVTATAVLEVDVPMADEVAEVFLEVRDVATGLCVTVVELLSPVNKLLGHGRQTYLEKRTDILRTRTSLVEMDLLRAGEPMPLVGPAVRSDYRILVSRGARRPRAQLFAWSLRQPIPTFELPLLKGDLEPTVDLGAVLHALYDRARFDLRLDYGQPPVPPLAEDDTVWARSLALPRS
jgi:uncharacterized protein DUF4058